MHLTGQVIVSSLTRGGQLRAGRSFEEGCCHARRATWCCAQIGLSWLLAPVLHPRSCFSGVPACTQLLLQRPCFVMVHNQLAQGPYADMYVLSVRFCASFTQQVPPLLMGRRQACMAPCTSVEWHTGTGLGSPRQRDRPPAVLRRV